MNRFRSRKKSFHDGGAEPPRPGSTESDLPALPIFSSKTFRRNKKNQPEPKSQVDISKALPPSDDFRTSLIMPNLSARFSMLREQDDPHSKIGKANDDSVLFPKRASRLDLFNTGGLRDISEDGSIHAPIRPPFSGTRTESYGSNGTNWTDEDRSMISRARPGEGNTMFGGRQKIYKIPVGASGSTKSFGDDEHQPRGGMGGKALYGDDLATSTFPKPVERDVYNNERAEADRDGQSRSSDERSNSPPFTKYNRNRETTSSTNSGPSAGRTSTAATSVASQRSVYGGQGLNGIPHAVTQGAGHPQPSERSGPKSRRLYGQGLDQHMHDQQYSAMNRLESLHRQRTNGASQLGRLHGSGSATNLNDRFQRSGPVDASNDFRAASPPPSGPALNVGDFDLGLTPEPADSRIDSGHGKSPPLSPPMNPIQDNTFLASLEPNDLGKATASGAFSKPKQYSEQQYLQRQLQLQQGRESPSLVRPFSPSAASINEQMTGRTRDSSLAGPQPQAGSLLRGQERSTSNMNQARSAEIQYPSTHTTEDRHNAAMENSFLSNLSSEAGSPVDSYNEQELFPPSASYQSPVNTSSPHNNHTRAPEENPREHAPANDRHVKLLERSVSDSHSEITVTEEQAKSGFIAFPDHVDADSPTLGPSAGMTSVNGLNGLVRAHLRNDSGQSSIYPEPSPGVHSRFPDDAPHRAHSNRSIMNGSTTFFHESALDPEDRVPENRADSNLQTSDMPSSLSLRARQILKQATALRDTSPKAQQMLGENKAQRVLGREAPRPSYENAMTWQEQMRAHHTRGGSTETEKERESFANELAERRRAVQDNLRSFVENESRSSSPAPGSRTTDSNQKRSPFGILKSKTSRDSLASKQEQPSKAMKMLGIGPNANLPNGSPRPSQEENFSRPLTREQRQPQTDGRGPQPRVRTQGRRHQHPESRPESSEKESSPPTSRSSRERSGSEASERRYGNRNARPTNDVLIEEEAGGSNPASPASKHRPKEYSDAPRTLDEPMASIATHQNPERSQSDMSGRLRSNSKAGYQGYFAGQPNTPYTANSPSTPGYSVRSAPSLHEGVSTISYESVPIMIPPKSSHSAYSAPKPHRFHRKESIHKHDISEPIFKSCTSSVDVVDLPPEASLKNGMDPPPPIPPLNPRRRRTQTLLQALGRLENSHPIPPSMKPSPYNDQNGFPPQASTNNNFRRHRLRKSSSEGGNLNVRARQEAMMAPNPAVPSFAQTMSAQQSPVKSRFPPHVQQPPQHGHGPQDESEHAVMF
ncbi:MAG: hypothetical protein LQ338_004396 [Usnochroma carphineum]|nr:MAG: hypothetical protein LQ338_004396 [Usnochroma carphineum]